MRKSVHTAEYAALRRHLREARAAAGLSQRGLAKQLDVPHTWVAKVESGERRIDLLEAAWFFAACDVEPMPAFASILAHATTGLAKRRTGGKRS